MREKLIDYLSYFQALRRMLVDDRPFEGAPDFTLDPAARDDDEQSDDGIIFQMNPGTGYTGDISEALYGSNPMEYESDDDALEAQPGIVPTAAAAATEPPVEPGAESIREASLIPPPPPPEPFSLFDDDGVSSRGSSPGASPHGFFGELAVRSRASASAAPSADDDFVGRDPAYLLDQLIAAASADEDEAMSEEELSALVKAIFANPAVRMVLESRDDLRQLLDEFRDGGPDSLPGMGGARHGWG